MKNVVKNFNQSKGNSSDSSGRSIIHLLVRNNKLNIMKSLIKQFPNLNLNIGTVIDNWHPLHNAIYFNNKGNYIEMIELLLSQGITKNWNLTYSWKYNLSIHIFEHFTQPRIFICLIMIWSIKIGAVLIHFVVKNYFTIS